MLASASGSTLFVWATCSSWKRDKGGDDVPANLYAVRFFNNGETGFVLGNDCVLLRYIGA